MTHYLAQVNIAKSLAPLDHPLMAGFVAHLDPINALAESSPGFIWRLKDDSNNATAVKVYDDDFIIFNMSVWENIETLFHFTYRSDHAAIFRQRKEWFEKMPEMHMALWYVPATHRPTVDEAVNKLNHLRCHGDTPLAFTFKNRFTLEEATAANR